MTASLVGILTNCARALEALTDHLEAQGDTDVLDDLLYRQQPRLMAFGADEAANRLRAAGIDTVEDIPGPEARAVLRALDALDWQTLADCYGMAPNDTDLDRAVHAYLTRPR